MENKTTDKPLISIARAAELAGITESTAYRWLRRGELPGAVVVGGRWRVRRRVLQAWLDGQEYAAPAEGQRAA